MMNTILSGQSKRHTDKTKLKTQKKSLINEIEYNSEQVANTFPYYIIFDSKVKKKHDVILYLHVLNWEKEIKRVQEVISLIYAHPHILWVITIPQHLMKSKKIVECMKLWFDKSNTEMLIIVIPAIDKKTRLLLVEDLIPFYKKKISL